MTVLRLLTVGGSDPTGGAGIQADLKTFMAHGAHGLSVVTSLIAGNTRELRSLHLLPPEFVADQLDALLSDIGADAIKTGLLGSAATIEVVARRLQAERTLPIVIDPVLVAKSGTRIMDEAAVRAMLDHLLPLATVATPNVREAQALTGRSIATVDDMVEAARDLLDCGPRVVVVKGRGLPGDGATVVDVVVDQQLELRLPAPRVPTSNIRGTGCTLSAALAVHLARGVPVAEAANLARQWVIDLLRVSADGGIGQGVGPLLHGAAPPPTR